MVFVTIVLCLLWMKTLLYFKYAGNRFGSSQFLSAFAGGTPANFEMEFAGFEGELAIIVEERHHLRGDGEFQLTAFTSFEHNSFETDEMMKRDNA